MAQNRLPDFGNSSLSLIHWSSLHLACFSICCHSLFCFERKSLWSLLVTVHFSQTAVLHNSEAVGVRGGDDIWVTHMCAVGRLPKCLCLQAGGHGRYHKLIFLRSGIDGEGKNKTAN